MEAGASIKLTVRSSTIRISILDMLQDDLIKNGVAADHIISMRYTSEDFDDSMTDKDMYNGIKEKMIDGERYYLLLDELAAGNINGVKIVHLADFLLNEKY